MELPQWGRRGGGWVALQFAVLAAVAAVAGWAWLGSGPPDWGRLAAAALVMLTGAALVVGAAAALGSALVPWPRPVGDDVVRSGPYRFVRHPLYSGGLLMCVGTAIATTAWVLLPTAVLGVVWALKCRVEERMLQERFPGYAAYRKDVRWRIVPGIY